MTIEEVKAKLPDVTVRIGNQVVSAQLAGRMSEYARVFVSVSESKLSAEFSWEAVTRAINAGSYLEV